MNISQIDAGAVLGAIAPRFSGDAGVRQAEIIEAIADDFTSTLAQYEINTPLRVAHFIAQLAHESAGFRTTEEFASGAAYEGRVTLGNTVPGDGKRYKGRGLLQLTGRANYRRVGELIGVDLEANPHIAAEPLTSLKIACVYWQDKKINPLCDADDFVGVTKKVNGGTNGLEDRRRYLAKAKQVLASPVVASVDEPLVHPHLLAHADLKQASTAYSAVDRTQATTGLTTVAGGTVAAAFKGAIDNAEKITLTPDGIINLIGATAQLITKYGLPFLGLAFGVVVLCQVVQFYQRKWMTG